MSNTTSTNVLGQPEKLFSSSLDPLQETPAARPAFETRARVARAQSDGFVLGFVAGFVDAAGYLALFGLFSANMTGNILLLAVALVEPSGDIALNRLIAIPLFMFGVILGWLIAAQVKRRAGRVAPILIAGEAIALALFVTVGMHYGAQLHSGKQQTLIIGISAFSLIAMGLQNVLGRELSADMPTTTAMTNNLSQLVLEGAAVMGARFNPQALAATTAARERFAWIGRVFVGFLIGAMVGALGMRQLGYPSVGVPIVLLALLAVGKLKTDIR